MNTNNFKIRRGVTIPVSTGRRVQGNFIYLLTGLLSLLLIGPVVAEYFPEYAEIREPLAFFAIMFIGVWSFLGNRLWFYIGMALTVSIITLSFVNFFMPSTNLEILILCVALLFCVLSVIIATSQVMFSNYISANELIGSVCVYLLLGVIWALLYLVIDLLSANAFQKAIPDSGQEAIWEYIYFSFITLTTLGYGDISPVNQIARTLVYLEAICGQFYIAILVANLVGGFMTEQKNKHT